jgi:hypothetical protein
MGQVLVLAHGIERVAEVCPREGCKDVVKNIRSSSAARPRFTYAYWEMGYIWGEAWFGKDGWVLIVLGSIEGTAYSLEWTMLMVCSGSFEMVLSSTSLMNPTVPRKVLKRFKASCKNFPIRFSEKYELLLVQNMNLVATARLRALLLIWSLQPCTSLVRP